MIKRFLIIFLILFNIIILVNADSNGIWYYPKDMRAGIFGSDEMPITNYTFKSKVYFENNIFTNQIFDINDNNYFLDLDFTSQFNKIISNNSIVLENVGIGIMSPTQKLDVNGKIRMRTQTQDIDGDDIVVTKGYVDNLVASSSGGLDYIEYKNPGTYSFTVPEGVEFVYVTLIGAGGGASGSNYWGAGGIGGNGGQIFDAQIFVTEGEIYIIEVGQGGNRGASNGADWCAGGMTGETGGSSILKKDALNLVTSTGGRGGDKYAGPNPAAPGRCDDKKNGANGSPNPIFYNQKYGKGGVTSTPGQDGYAKISWHS